ncbi:hypothetical protein [Thermococcus pacificus]|uniref:Uncharacterized protein n=1 Tax=Thermococcus pacificus TaxID=71998 RepID=A0A218P850_9EURY|nr:hypothetical protein [Thermococcus pacificus]ASJ06952.1 hypothetical protein A3L08_06255 [Thermococcus pacificus]
MRGSAKALVILIGAVYLIVGYFLLSTSVSWESKGEFNALSNVSYSGRVFVDIPLELELMYDVYPELGHDEFKSFLRNAIEEVLISHNLWPDFTHVRPVVVLPGDSPPDRVNAPVVVIFTNFQGRENRFYYESCYASVLIYMNSNGDVGSYLSVERKYSEDSSKTDDLSNFARDLYETARARGNSTGDYSLKVVYWNVLEVRTGKFSGKNCWEMLTGEIVKEVDEWASTLDYSDEP